MALHRKIDAPMALRPDLAVISEAAEPGRLLDRAPVLAEASLVRVGGIRTRGSCWPASARPASNSTDAAMTVACTGWCRSPSAGCPVWTRPFTCSASGPRTPARAIDRRTIRDSCSGPFGATAGFCVPAPAVVAGDFNNHVQWDRPGWRMNHANEIRALARLGLVSAYHVSRGVEAGNEPEPTFYRRRRAVDGYHIDYVFMPEEWSTCAFDLTVGPYGEVDRSWPERPRTAGARNNAAAMHVRQGTTACSSRRNDSPIEGELRTRWSGVRSYPAAPYTY